MYTNSLSQKTNNKVDSKSVSQSVVDVPNYKVATSAPTSTPTPPKAHAPSTKPPKPIHKPKPTHPSSETTSTSPTQTSEMTQAHRVTPPQTQSPTTPRQRPLTPPIPPKTTVSLPVTPDDTTGKTPTPATPQTSPFSVSVPTQQPVATEVQQATTPTSAPVATPQVAQTATDEPRSAKPESCSLFKKLTLLTILPITIILVALAYYFVFMEYDVTQKKGSEQVSDELLTLENIALHNTDEDCWVIVDNTVFDVTANVEGHLTAFACGEDMSEVYNEQHGKDITDTLAQFKIGTVSVKDFSNLEVLKDSLRIFRKESELPDDPLWAAGDFLHLMGIVQADYETGAIGIINTRTLEDIGHISGVGNNVHVMEYHPNQRWLYTISRDGLVSKIDIYTLQILRQIKVGTDSRGMAFSHDAKYIAIGNYNPFTSVILNSETLEPLRIIKTEVADTDGNTVGSRVAGVFGLDSKELFVINLKDAGEVLFIEQNPPFNIVKTLSSGELLHQINSINRDETILSVTSQKDNTYSFIDIDTLEIIKVIDTPDKPHPGEGTIDYENSLWFANSMNEAKVTVIDTERLELTASIWPDGIDISAGGGLFSTPLPPNSFDVKYILFDIVFGDNLGTIYVVDRNAVVRGGQGTEPVIGMFNWIDFGFTEQGRIIAPEYSYDGKYVLLSAWDYDKVIVIDVTALPELKIVKEFDMITPTGIFPAWTVQEPYLH